MQSDEGNNNKNELKNIRKAQGLTKKEVAGKIKLTTDAITKIEESDFSNLGAYTYVRGYIIHYTELLGVDSEKYIAMIPRAEIEVPLINTSSSVTKGIKLKRQSKSFASYAVGTFIVLAVSFSGWYLLKNYTNQKIDNSVLVDSKSNELKISPQFTNDSNPAVEELAKNVQTNKSDAYHYSSLIPTEENTKTNDKIEEETPLNSFSNAQDSSQQAVLAVENEAIETLAYQIQIQAMETSWVEVEEIEGQKLHNDLLKPGTVSLQSDKPVHFRIGNENQVQVFINGEKVDLSQYSRKNIADFNWPPEG